MLCHCQLGNYAFCHSADVGIWCFEVFITMNVLICLLMFQLHERVTSGCCSYAKCSQHETVLQ